MATILHKANKTDAAIFLPSSSALRRAVGRGRQLGRASASTPTHFPEVRVEAAEPPLEAGMAADPMGFDTVDFGDEEDAAEDADI